MDMDTVLGTFMCKICKHLVKIPKYLSCGHYVCEKCLQLHIIRTVPMTGYDLHEYIGVKKEKIEVKPTQDYFVCPADGCDNKYNVRNPKVNTAQWAIQIKNCIKSVHFIELFQGKRKRAKSLCEICICSPQPVTATVICTGCFHLFCYKCTFIHKQISPTHKIVDVSTFQTAWELLSSDQKAEGNQDIACNVSTKLKTENLRVVDDLVATREWGNVSPRESNVCLIHRPCEKVLYCKDCAVLSCIKCSETIHASCRNIHTIQTLYKKLLGEKMDNASKSRLQHVQENCSANISRYMVYEVRINNLPLHKLDEMKDKVVEVQEKISTCVMQYEYLYNRAQRCKAQIENIEYHESSVYISTFFSVEQECMQLEEDLHRVLAKSNETDIITRIKLIENESRNNSDRGDVTVEDGSPSRSNNITDVLDPDIDLTLGLHRLKFEKEEKEKIVEASDELEWLANILIKSKSDKSDCWLTDCLFLQNMDIVVADHANNKISLIHECQMTQEIRLESAPWGITVDEDKQECFVSLPKSQKIIVLTIKDNRLATCSEIKTHGCVYGLGLLNSESLLVCSKDVTNSSIDLLYRNGDREDLKIKDRFPNGREKNTFERMKLIENESMPIKPVYMKVSKHANVVQVHGTDYQRNIFMSFGLKKLSQYKEESEEQMSDFAMRTKQKDTEDASASGFSRKLLGDPSKGNADNDGELSRSASINDIQSVAEEQVNETEEDSGHFEDGSSRFLDFSIDSSKDSSLDPANTRVTSKRTDGLSLDFMKSSTFNYPAGFDIDQSDNVYVCCNADCKVFRLNKDGKKRFQLLNVPLPRAISVQADRLILTVDSGPRKNFVMVYRLTQNVTCD